MELCKRRPRKGVRGCQPGGVASDVDVPSLTNRRRRASSTRQPQEGAPDPNIPKAGAPHPDLSRARQAQEEVAPEPQLPRAVTDVGRRTRTNPESQTQSEALVQSEAQAQLQLLSRSVSSTNGGRGSRTRQPPRRRQGSSIPAPDGLRELGRTHSGRSRQAARRRQSTGGGLSSPGDWGPLTGIPSSLGEQRQGEAGLLLQEGAPGTEGRRSEDGRRRAIRAAARSAVRKGRAGSQGHLPAVEAAQEQTALGTGRAGGDGQLSRPSLEALDAAWAVTEGGAASGRPSGSAAHPWNAGGVDHWQGGHTGLGQGGFESSQNDVDRWQAGDSDETEEGPEGALETVLDGPALGHGMALDPVAAPAAPALRPGSGSREGRGMVLFHDYEGIPAQFNSRGGRDLPDGEFSSASESCRAATREAGPSHSPSTVLSRPNRTGGAHSILSINLSGEGALSVADKYVIRMQKKDLQIDIPAGGTRAQQATASGSCRFAESEGACWEQWTEPASAPAGAEPMRGSQLAHSVGRLEAPVSGGRWVEPTSAPGRGAAHLAHSCSLEPGVGRSLTAQRQRQQDGSASPATPWPLRPLLSTGRLRAEAHNFRDHRDPRLEKPVDGPLRGQHSARYRAPGPVMRREWEEHEGPVSCFTGARPTWGGMRKPKGDVAAKRIVPLVPEFVMERPQSEMSQTESWSCVREVQLNMCVGFLPAKPKQTKAQPGFRPAKAAPAVRGLSVGKAGAAMRFSQENIVRRRRTLERDAWPLRRRDDDVLAVVPASGGAAARG